MCGVSLRKYFTTLMAHERLYLRRLLSAKPLIANVKAHVGCADMGFDMNCHRENLNWSNYAPTNSRTRAICASVRSNTSLLALPVLLSSIRASLVSLWVTVLCHRVRGML